MQITVEVDSCDSCPYIKYDMDGFHYCPKITPFHNSIITEKREIHKHCPYLPKIGEENE